MSVLGCGYVVEVEFEDHDDTTGFTLIYGPFRSYTRALAVAERVGRDAGLNRNGQSGWTGTDGGTRFGLVYVRALQPPDTNRLNDAIQRLLEWFHPEKEATE